MDNILGVLAATLASFVLGGPGEGAAITQQPKGFWLFLLDATLVTWILIGFGEEFVFRGFILNRLLSLTGESQKGLVIASLLQAVWFGAGHASQGLTGMIITGAITVYKPRQCPAPEARAASTISRGMLRSPARNARKTNGAC